MVIRPTTVKTVSSKSISSIARVCEQSPRKRGSRSVKQDSETEQTIRCPKEGHDRKKSDPRPEETEPIYSLRYIQNDNSGPSEKNTSSRKLGSKYRPERRILACSDSSEIQKVSGIQTGKQIVQIQSDAVWTEHCAQNVYKTSQCDSEVLEEFEGLGSGISRRLASVGTDQSRMRSSSEKDSKRNREKGFCSQPGKVKADSFSELSMVRSAVGFEKRHFITPDRNAKESEQFGENFHGKESSDKTSFRKSDWTSAVLRDLRSVVKSQFEKYKQTLARFSFQQAKGQVTHNDKETESSIVPMEKSISFPEENTAETWAGDTPDSHRRLQMGLGGSFLGRSDDVGEMVSSDEQVSHQLPGTSGSGSSTQEIQSAPRSPYKTGHGQPHSSILHNERGEQIDVPQRCDEVDSEVVNQEAMDCVSSPYQWNSECPSGFSFTTRACVHRVETRQDVICPSDEDESQATNRHVCDEQQPPATSICVPSPREQGSGTECFPIGLEFMEDDLSISSDTFNFEGFESPGVIQRDSLPHCSRVAQQSVVSSFVEEGQMQDSLEECYIVPSCKRSDLLRVLLTEPGPTYMGFLRQIYKYTTSDEELLDRLVKGVRDSTNAQYHSTWKRFVRFLQCEKPRNINADIVMRFLNKEFKDGKQASTLASYKSALKTPLMLGFGFHMDHSVIQTLSKNFALERPKSKGKVFNWKLTDILDLLSSDEYNGDNISPDNCLQKTLFLLSLVSGYRADEVFAFYRGGAYISRQNNGYTLHPIESHRAKNETDTNQREPLTFKELTENEKLCPVRSLDKYLEMTAQYDKGRLFRNSRVGSSLSLKSYSKILSALASKASGKEPGEIQMTVHHIRSVATSFAAARGATHSELATFTGWKSSKVFEDHYVTHIESPRHVFMACGRVIRPDIDQLP